MNISVRRYILFFLCIALISCSKENITLKTTTLPQLIIDCEESADNISREKYSNATLQILNNYGSDLPAISVRIRGKGNSSWYVPKKSYRIELQKSASLLGMPADKSWVLIANYYDKTMLRNSLGFYLSRLSNLAYTPRSAFVEVTINGKAQGTYLLCERVKISSNRVPAGENGYLLEIDAKAHKDDCTFNINHIYYPINIHYPQTDYGSAKYTYIVSYMRRLEDCLFNQSNSRADWHSMLDMQSFADWYIINEIAKNNDANLFTSCYMYLREDGRLCMGPVWDFDIGFGNFDSNGNDSPEGFYIKNGTEWFSRLFEMPEFRSLVRQRYDYFYSCKNDILDFIHLSGDSIASAADNNEQIWHTMDKQLRFNPQNLTTYEDNVNYLIDWLNRRMNWLREQQYDN